jgi:hypothetical protein
LRHDRRRVHVHRRSRAQGVAAAPDGVDAQLPGARPASKKRVLEKVVEAESFERFCTPSTSATSVSRSRAAKR